MFWQIIIQKRNRMKSAAFKEIEHRFIKIRDFWCWGAPSPKHLSVDREVMERHLCFLTDSRDYLYDYALYDHVCSEIRRAINKLDKSEKEQNVSDEDAWKNISEHGFNKVVRPVTIRYAKTENKLCWQDKYGQQEMRFTSNFSSWHFAAIDVIAYLFLLQDGGKLPSQAISIFENIQNLTDHVNGNNAENTDHNLTVSFSDKFFRKLSGFNYSSAQIKKLITETSSCEFKLSYPAMIFGEGGKKKEYTANMKNHSPLFTLSIDDKMRADGNIANRLYTVDFNTTLGIMFIHNLMMKNYGFIDNRHYRLNPLAQIFFRKYILSNNSSILTIGMDKIIKSLNFTNQNKTIITDSIIKNILEPLKEKSVILEYSFKEGLLDDKKMIIRIPKESKVAKDKSKVAKDN